MEEPGLEFNIIGNSMVELGMSGGNRIFIEFAKRWLEKGTRINIFTPNIGEKLCKDNGLRDCRFITWQSSNYDCLGIISLYLMGTFKGISSILKEPHGKNAVMYSSSDFWPDSLPGLIFKLKNRNIKWIASLYLFAPNPLRKDSPYERKNFVKGLIYWLSQIPVYWLIRRYADVVFVTNEPDRKRFISKRLTPDKVIAIRGGVDVRAPSLVPEPAQKDYDAVFMGRYHAQKGVLELIDIWRHVYGVKKDARLALIGIGELENEMKKKIRRYNLENNIDFFGFKDGKEKNEIFKNCKVALYPATVDHWSMAPVEAMACGLPLVTFDISTLKHLSPKGMIKTPCFDLKEYANGILRLLNDEELYQKTRADAIDWANQWDWDKRAEEIFQIIKDCA